MKQSYYEILGVSHTASKEEITASFKRMAKTTHPNVNWRVNANEAMAKLTEAYKNLSSSSKRAEYNSRLSQSDIRRIEENHRLYSNALAMFAKLGENVGKDVTILHTWYGHLDTAKGELKNVTEFANIEVASMNIPFIGSASAILSVTNNGTGEVLYSNINVAPNYDEKSLQDKTRVIALSWGHAEAQRHFDVETAQDRKWKEDKEKANNEAKQNKPRLIEEGLKYIKPELADEWTQWANKNTDEAYSACGVEDENVKGTINPAVLTIEVSEKSDTPAVKRLK